MLPFFAIIDDHFWDILINPKIIEYIGEKHLTIEGCLTWVGKKIIVDRYQEIRVEYTKLNGEFRNEILRGFKAQIFQHECDHLNGVEEIFKED